MLSTHQRLSLASAPAAAVAAMFSSVSQYGVSLNAVGVAG